MSVCLLLYCSDNTVELVRVCVCVCVCVCVVLSYSVCADSLWSLGDESQWIIRHIRFNFLVCFSRMGWTGWDGMRGEQFPLRLHHYIHLGKQTGCEECMQTHQTGGVYSVFDLCLSNQMLKDALMNLQQEDESLRALCGSARWNIIKVGLLVPHSVPANTHFICCCTGQTEALLFTLILKLILRSINTVCFGQRETRL